MKSKRKNLHKLSNEDLQKDLASCQEALLKLRFQKVVEEVADTTIIRKTKKKIARIKTILRLRELGKV